ncbi:hypothetical protein ACT3SP_05010 [Brachybacterium sp. AOP43-C2-M15]|uniref:hypothetical protein n=1 Tax=Brachybacterium sp. AOP43-C2-M15 TaxID=3457661 RepID=UPI004034F5F6
MTMKSLRRACIYTIIAAFALGAAPAIADPAPPDSVDQLFSTTSIRTAKQDPRLDGMSDAEKDKIIEIATDPRFGVPELADDLSSDYPELEVDRISGAGAPPGTIDTMATGNRAYVTLNWKVAGVKYASVTTEANFDNSGAKVTRVNNCWGSSSNFLPGIRTVEGNSYHSLSGGILTCKTDWTAKFIVGNDRRTTQGLQVTGNGTFLDQWPKG